MAEKLETLPLAERQRRQISIFGSESERRVAIQKGIDEYFGNVLTFQRQGITAASLATVNLRDEMLLDLTTDERKMIAQAVETRTARTFV